MFSKKTLEDIGLMNTLHGAGFDLLASKGTRETALGINPRLEITDIADLTGRGPILNHKVVSLEGSIHAPLLADEPDLEELLGLEMSPIHVLACTLYDLESALIEYHAGKRCPADTNKMADRGGVAVLLSACKGNRVVLCDQSQYDWVGEKIQAGTLTQSDVLDLQAEAAGRCAAYIAAETRFRQQAASIARRSGLSTPYAYLGGARPVARHGAAA